MLVLLIFGLWCAASFSGAGASISEAFAAFLFAGLAGLGIMYTLSPYPLIIALGLSLPSSVMVLL